MAQFVSQWSEQCELGVYNNANFAGAHAEIRALSELIFKIEKMKPGLFPENRLKEIDMVVKKADGNTFQRCPCCYYLTRFVNVISETLLPKMNIRNHQNQPFKRLEIAQQIPTYLGISMEDLTFWEDKPFEGRSTDPNTGEIFVFFRGLLSFSILPYGKLQAISFYSCNQLENGYIFNGTQLQTNNFGLDRMSENTNENEYWNIHDACLRTQNEWLATEYQRWLGDRSYRNQQDKGLQEDGRDYFEIYEQQTPWKAQLRLTDTLPASIRYVVAIDVGYDLLNLRIAASLVLCDLKTKQITLTKVNTSDIRRPHYCNDLFPQTDLEVVNSSLSKKHPQRLD